ncbi:hypothetical protein GG804_25730 [Sphingomonas histidinilytica]|uniref:hypothetical protein n=1 Tax=Rhizorhabdus histidinilytica TaxID=439228 RepID=UPI001ADA9813|nr:hypothetical protein [Rhizorhabdus histidinilytica]MBO9380173.1 hypothetical protein [Rhizorhabdus histidinilytica]
MIDDPNVETRVLNSPGPISEAFLDDRSFLSVIIGPVGSAKTMTALRKLRHVGMRQGFKLDGRGRKRRKARCGVIRETYPSIEKNTLPSWFRIHPESDGVFSRKAPYSHKLNLILDEDEYGQATDICELEMEFRAIGDQGVEAACRGWEVNAVMIDEADLQPPDLIAFLSGRVGRFSDLDPSLVVDPQIILSLNAPYMDNWVYKLAVERELGDLLSPELVEALGDRKLIETFIQPGGRSPGAENLHNLPKGYYAIQAALNKHRPSYVARMVDNKFVPQQFGQPVNPGFSYEQHVREIEWDPARDLILGVDQGLFAAGVAQQHTPMAQLRTLAECVIMHEDGKTLMKIGPTAFGQMCRQMLNDHFFDLRPEKLRVRADPAAFAAADRADNEHQWVLAFQAGLGIRGVKVRPARTNAATPRLEVIHRAMAEIDGYAVHSRCKHLIRGHLGGYRYAKATIGEGESRGRLEIANTIYTHVCDGEQYAALEADGAVDFVLGKADRRGRQRSRAQPRVDHGQGYFSGRQ